MTTNLPLELWMKVYECLPAPDLCYTMPLVCWDLRYAAFDESLWKKLYLHHFNIVILSHKDENSPEDWRHRYMDRRKMVAAKGLVEFSELLKTLLRDPLVFGRNNVMNMYTTVFHFCISNNRVRDYGTNHLGLYQMVVDSCVEYLDEMCREGTLISVGDNLLNFYVDVWERYQTVIKRFNTIFAYFQRDYRTRQDREGDLFERMVNAYIANKNWKSNVVLGITPMMIVNWLKRFFNPLQQSLKKSIDNGQQSTTKRMGDSLMSLLQLSQCQTFPQEVFRELITQLQSLMGGENEDNREIDDDVAMEDRIEMMMGWLAPSAGVAVQ